MFLLGYILSKDMICKKKHTPAHTQTAHCECNADFSFPVYFSLGMNPIKSCLRKILNGMEQW